MTRYCKINGFLGESVVPWFLWHKFYMICELWNKYCQSTAKIINDSSLRTLTKSDTWRQPPFSKTPPPKSTVPEKKGEPMLLYRSELTACSFLIASVFFCHEILLWYVSCVAISLWGCAHNRAPALWCRNPATWRPKNPTQFWQNFFFGKVPLIGAKRPFFGSLDKVCWRVREAEMGPGSFQCFVCVVYRKRSRPWPHSAL